MRSRRSFLRSLLLALSASVVACTEDNLSVITPGTLEVTAETLGVDRDVDGYTVQLDTRPAQVLGLVGTFRDLGVEPGTHRILLGGLAANCAVDGENPRTLTIGPGEHVRVTFQVTCSTTIGALNIRTTTRGPFEDSDGYTVTVDGVNRGIIGSQDGVNIHGLNPGNHVVALGGMAENCQVEGDNPRTVTVTAGKIMLVPFGVTCLGGSLTISVTTTGASPDPDGYTVSVDDGSEQHTDSNGELKFPDLTPREHTVVLAGLSANCGVDGGDRQQVLVIAEQETTFNFRVDCPTPWASMESGIDARLTDVWVAPAAEPLAGFATGAPGEILALGQAGWSKETLAQPWQVNGVWGRSAADAFAVGGIDTERPPGRDYAFRAVVLHRQGGAWLEMPGLTPPAGSTPSSLNEIWGTTKELFAAGTLYSSLEGEIVGGFVAHHDGAAWSTTLMLPNEGIGLNDVSGSSASNVYAVGGAFHSAAVLPGPGAVFHYDGATWTQVWRKDMTDLTAVWVGSSEAVFVAGLDYTDYFQDGDVTGFVLRYDGTSWSEILRERGLFLTGFWGSSPTDVYAVGTAILHYDGVQWMRQSTPTNSYLRAIWGRSPSEIYVVGYDGTILKGPP